MDMNGDYPQQTKPSGHPVSDEVSQWPARQANLSHSRACELRMAFTEEHRQVIEQWRTLSNQHRKTDLSSTKSIYTHTHTPYPIIFSVHMCAFGRACYRVHVQIRVQFKSQISPTMWAAGIEPRQLGMVGDRATH